jgi:outer membrane protein
LVTRQNTHEVVLAKELQYQYRLKTLNEQLTNNNNQSLGFYLSIPIFNGWTGRTNISLAKIQREKADLDLEIQKRDLRKTIEQAYADATSSLQQYDASLQKVTAQEESFKYTQQKFDVGMMTSFDYNNSTKRSYKSSVGPFTG